MKKLIYIVLFIITSIGSFFYFQNHFYFENEPDENRNALAGQDSILTATISFVGDLMCHSVQFSYARVEKDSFDFRGVFREVKPYLSSADFTIGNLETVLAGKGNGYSGYPYFNAPDDFLYALKDAGFDLLVTANNHALDQGFEGVLNTINKMDKIGLNHTGTFVSEADRDSIRIFNINGIEIAVLAYSYGTNGISIPKGKNYVINLIDDNRIKSDIDSARERGAELVITYFHFGEEYEREPNIYQKGVVQKTMEAGADIIIGSHPHVVQPVEFFKTNNGNLDTGFIAYSLGNFISNQRWRYSDSGVILNLKISKNIKSDSLFIEEVSYLPVWVFKGKTKVKNEYIIFPSNISIDDSSYSFLSTAQKNLMFQSFSDTKEILTRYDRNVSLVTE